MEREVICSGHSGYGTYCSKCGAYKCGWLTVDISYRCLSCGSEKFTVYSPTSLMIVRSTKEEL